MFDLSNADIRKAEVTTFDGLELLEPLEEGFGWMKNGK
jgi:hypothetical protein